MTVHLNELKTQNELLNKKVKSATYGYVAKRLFLHKSAILASLMGGSIFLSGCSSMSVDSKANQQDSPATTLVQDKPEKNTPQKVVGHAEQLDSRTMFSILAAEMMMQKKIPGQAFEVLYPLAVKTKDPNLAERTFEVAMQSYNVKNIEKATALWKEVSPKSAVAWRASFLLTLRHNEVVKALEEWDTYRSLSNESLSEELISAAGKVASTVPKEPGTEFFQALTKKYPNEWASFYGLGMVSAVYHNPAVGIVAMQKAKPLLPKADKEKSLPVFYNLLSQLYLMDNQPVSGIKELTPYAKKHPEDLLIQERIARLEVQAKQYDAAEKRYTAILKVQPKALTSRLSLALIQIEQNKYEQAEQNLNLINVNPEYQPVANYYLGILFQENSQNEKAIQAFEKIDNGSYFLDSQLHLAEIYFAEKNITKAFDVLNKIVPKDEEEKVKLLRANAIFNATQNHFTKAINYYDQALEIEPDNLEILKSESLIFYNLKQYDNYESNLLRVLKVDDNDVDALNALGYFYVEQKIKLDQAHALLTKAISLEPESYYILDSLGWYYYQVKQYEKSIEYLEKAFSIKEDDEVLIHLVSAYWQNKEVNRAKLLWKKYHKNFLQNDRVQNLINELELGTTK